MKLSRERKNSIRKRIGALLAALAVFACAALFAMPARAADPAVATLPVSQRLNTAKTPDNAIFTYELKRSPATPFAPLPDGGSGDTYLFTITADTTEMVVQTLQISFPNTGEYEYTLKCVDCSEPLRFELDPEMYIIKAFAYGGGADIFVYTVPEQGMMEGYKVDPASTPLFTHTRTHSGEPDPLVAVDPPVKKRITGTPARQSTFRFRLRSEEEGNPMPEGSVNGEKFLDIQGEGEGEFGTWVYTEPGTYNYDINEVNTSDPDYEYDTRMYTITDVVTRVENGPDVSLRVDRTIVDSNGNQVASTRITPEANNERVLPLEFTNKYVGGSGVDPTPTPGGTGGRSSTGKIGSVKTGDENRPVIWIALIAGAAALLLIILLIVILKRRGNGKD